MSTLDYIVRRGAGRSPDQVVIIDGEIRWTWREFDEQVTRAAVVLGAAGVGPGDRVAAAGYNSAGYFALYYGAARLGTTICPLNYLSAPDELDYVLADLEPSLIITAPAFHEVITGVNRRGVPVLTFQSPGADWEARIEAADPSTEFPDPDPESVHVILYTSGTTGRPKGVCHTQRAHYLDGLGTALGYGLRPGDRYVVHAPSFHGASWDHAKLLLISDGSIVITPRFDPVALMGATTEHRASILFGVPAVLNQLLSHPRWPEFDLSSVRLVYFGGALGSPRVLTDFAAALGRKIEYVQIYGLTEAGPFVTMADDATVAKKPKSIGKAVPGVQVDVIDSHTGRGVDTGVIGELAVRSETVMAGYWRAPEASAQVLRDGWLRTGDLAVRDAEGDFEIVDRLKDMVRSGGENVYAAEVERVLLDHPGVLDAAVIGLPDARWDERVVACVVTSGGVEAESITAFCRTRLAAYKVPKQIEFMAALPRTGIGKVAKQRLRDALATGTATGD